jgi:hypothetical protein
MFSKPLTMSHHGVNVTEVKNLNIRLSSIAVGALRKLLSKMSLLEKLELFSSYVSSGTELENCEVVIPSLKKLNITIQHSPQTFIFSYSVQPSIINFIIAEQLTTLTIKEADAIETVNCQSLVDLLIRSKHLKTLTVQQDTFTRVFKIENLSKFGFQLEIFKIELIIFRF